VGRAFVRWVSGAGVTVVFLVGVAGAQAQDAGTNPPDAATPAPAASDPDAGTAQPRTPQELDEPEPAEETDTPPSSTASGSSPTGTRPTPTPTATTTTPTETTTPRRAAATNASRAPRRRPAAVPTDDEPEEEEDRFRFAYLEASVGYSWINMAVIKQENFVPEFQTLEGSGFAVGGGAGFFISFVTLGLQAEWANHNGFDVGTVSLDLGIRIPTPFIEPYLRAGLGYVWLFDLEASDPMTGDQLWTEAPSIRGVVVDIGLGFDFMITPLVAVGIGADVALFNVSRSGGNPTNPGMVTLEDDGDAVGVQVSALAQLNLHF